LRDLRALRGENLFLRRFVLLLVVDFLEIGVDHLVVRLAARGARAGTGTPTSPGAAGGAAAVTGMGVARRLGLLVHRLAELHRKLGERLGLGGDRRDVVAGQHLAQFRDRRLERRLLGSRHLVAAVPDGALGGVDQALGLVLGLDQGALLLVLLGVALGVLDHALDIGVAQAPRGLDADLLLLAGRLV